jgi:S1-C subfamily serine protease
MGNDVITRIGEVEIGNLQGMTEALRSHRPGDVVEIRILRGGAEQRLTVTLGRRGG